jgi:rhamnosyltransferase
MFHVSELDEKYLLSDPADQLAVSTRRDIQQLFNKMREVFGAEKVIRAMIQSTNPYLLQQNLQLTRILPRHSVIPPRTATGGASQEQPAQQPATTKHERVALVIHSYFPDLVEYLLHYAKSMPSTADIYITTGSEEKASNIRSIFNGAVERGELKCQKVDVRVIPNRGRDVGAFLVGIKDVVRDYDLVCFAHDKKSSYMLPESVGEDWSDKLFECNLASKEYVQNIIQLFAVDEYLGLTFAPVPHHGMYFFLLGGKHNWRDNADITKQLQEKVGGKGKLGKKVLVDDALPLIAPLGSMFWARTAAIQKLYDLDWDYTDFPEEPLGLDSTISHAIERVWAYVSASSGYYSSYTMPDDYFATELGALLDYGHGFIGTLTSKKVSYGDPKTMAKSMAGLLGKQPEDGDGDANKAE